MSDRRPGSSAFADRIMAAVAVEATPSPGRAFMSAVHSRSARDAASAVLVAWHLGTVRRWRIPLRLRIRSMALVLGVAFVMGTGSLAAASALRVAAQPVANWFQPGVDEQGQVENQTPSTDVPRNGDATGAGGHGLDQPGQAQQQGDGGNATGDGSGAGVDQAGQNATGGDQSDGNKATSDGADGATGGTNQQDDNAVKPGRGATGPSGGDGGSSGAGSDGSGSESGGTGNDANGGNDGGNDGGANP